MYCVKKITDDLTWVGVNDRRLAMFEGVYSVPYGVSYNSYLLIDEKTVLFDTVDKAVRHRFMENVAEVLGKRKLDYLLVQHMEPDHSAVIAELAVMYPEMKIVCNSTTLTFLQQFYHFDIDHFDIDSRVLIISETETLNTGKHTLHFVKAPMVHWPEVMVVYDSADKILFSADAFGCFGALNGALFADEVDFDKDYMDEARRYYTNIVGKYGKQVRALLDQASALEIELICPLHGFVWRKKINSIVSKYELWSNYTPEEYGVMIAYASVYGNTENAADILACRLRDNGIKTVMYDVSVTPSSEIVAAAFRWSHLVFASTTYNAGIFISMEALISDLTAHNLQNRTVAIIENGTWAATSGRLMREKLQQCPNFNILPNTLRIKSGLKTEQVSEIAAMADALIATFPKPESVSDSPAAGTVHPAALRKLSYGLFVLTARDGGKDNGCIINTAAQITESPMRMTITVQKAHETCKMIEKTGEFNVSILDTSVPFRIFEQFGFRSGRETDKFAGCGYEVRTANGIRYLPKHTNGVLSAKVVESIDCGTHRIFIAEVTQASVLSREPSVTYQYYFDHIKPMPQVTEKRPQGFVCRICGYLYEGNALPDGYVCPLCGHGIEDFEPA